MSYILEALKKSEKERAMGAIPSLTSPHIDSPGGGKRSTVIAVAATFVILVLAFLLMFREQIAGLLSAGRGDPAAMAPGPGSPVSPGDKGARQSTAPQAVEQRRDTDAAEAAGVTPPASSGKDGDQPASPPGPLAIADNPPDDFPDIRIDALSYSLDPGKSFVMLNQQIFKAGSRVPGGLVIERIESEFIVVTYNGGRYRIRP